MPSFELGERIGNLALGGPRLDAPFAGSDRDPVVITRTRTDIVVYEVMPRSPPGNGGDLDSQLLHAISGNQTAIGHVPRKSRRLLAHDDLPHRRVNTVGANDHVGISGHAVVKLHFDAVAVLGQPDASMVEMKHAGGKRGAQKVEQIGPMEVIVGRAEVAFTRVGQRLSRELAPVVPSAKDDGVRPHSEAAHRLLESEPAQNSRRVGAYLNAGADLAQFRGLLKYVDVEAGASQRQRRREAADPCSDYYYSHGLARRLRRGARIRSPGIDPSRLSGRPVGRGALRRGGLPQVGTRGCAHLWRSPRRRFAARTPSA